MRDEFEFDEMDKIKSSASFDEETERNVNLIIDFIVNETLFCLIDPTSETSFGLPGFILTGR